MLCGACRRRAEDSFVKPCHSRANTERDTVLSKSPLRTRPLMTALKNRSAFDVDTDRSSGEWDERQLTYFFSDLRVHRLVDCSNTGEIGR